jgi:hypothetical protein
VSSFGPKKYGLLETSPSKILSSQIANAWQKKRLPIREPFRPALL